MKEKKSDFSLVNKDFDYIKSIDVTGLEFNMDILDKMNNSELKSHGFYIHTGRERSGYIRNIIDFDNEICVNYRVANHLPSLDNLIDERHPAIPTNNEYGNICLMFWGKPEYLRFTKLRSIGRSERSINVSKEMFSRIKELYNDYTIPYRIHIFIPNFMCDNDVNLLINSSLKWLSGNGQQPFDIPVTLSDNVYYRDMLFEGYFKEVDINESATFIPGGSFKYKELNLGTVTYVSESDSISYDFIIKLKECPDAFIKIWIDYYKKIEKKTNEKTKKKY